MWQKDTENQPRRIAITRASEEIAKLADIIIPAMYWKPGLPETLEAQLCAIQSAIDMLTIRSSKDKALFSQVLGDIWEYYSNPIRWLTDLEDDHMHMMLAVLRHAMKNCEPDILDSKRDPHRCFGKVAEALEQAFLYRTRGLDDVSRLSSGLFKTYDMIYRDAVTVLYCKMQRSRGSDESEKPNGCGSMLGEPARSFPKIGDVAEEETKEGESNGDEGEDPSGANRQAEEVAVVPQHCGCRHLLWKFKQTNERRSQKKQAAQDRKYNQIYKGYNPYRNTTKPSVPSPLGQVVDTSL
ncbi:uncharacterized protein PG998_003708 [Apiospora kogelbergensis]|uniref:uncharacterized protein n=1 Tax=Apiospora kogelbergensis TaxID=1337665 RepID=UPI00312EA5DF